MVEQFYIRYVGKDPRNDVPVAGVKGGAEYRKQQGLSV